MLIGLKRITLKLANYLCYLFHIFGITVSLLCVVKVLATWIVHSLIISGKEIFASFMNSHLNTLTQLHNFCIRSCTFSPTHEDFAHKLYIISYAYMYVVNIHQHLHHFYNYVCCCISTFSSCFELASSVNPAKFDFIALLIHYMNQRGWLATWWAKVSVVAIIH